MAPGEALAYLQALPDWERGTAANDETYTLDRMRRLLDLLDHPDQVYRIVHVVGTKGKGSTAAMIEACLRAAGYRSGLFISPHLVEYRERIRVDGRLIPAPELAAIVETRLRPAAQRLHAAGQRTPLHFEMLCALAFEHFRRQGVEVAVVEAGLGGRLDATNAVQHTALTVVTTIGYDHMAVLGETLSAIAGEKAAVIRADGLVVSSPQPPEAAAVIEAVCRERGAHLQTIGREWSYRIVAEDHTGSVFDLYGPGFDEPGLQVSLAGPHQVANAATAVAALHTLRGALPRLNVEAMRHGLAGTRWPGRLQIVGEQPAIVLDAAHNRESAAALAAALARLYPGQTFALLLGVFRDKDVAAVLRPLLPLAARVVATSPKHPRALPAADLVGLVRAQGVEAEEQPDVGAALARARELAGPQGRVLATGSLRLVGDVMMELGIDGNQG